MIFRSRARPSARHQRPFWLLVALSLLLLLWVSIAGVQAASPLRLTTTLQRDLGALRAQLEQIDPWQGEGARQTVAFNADLGDGGQAFQRQTLVTIAHAASRRLERLTATYRELGDDARLELAEALSYDMQGLSERVDGLARAASPGTVVALRDEVGATLDRLERSVALLSPSQTPPPARAGRPSHR